MQWLLTSHVRRHHRVHRTTGHVWQGRFKAFPIEDDDHLLTVLRYVEQNPLRAKLVRRAENWRWSSVGAGGSAAGLELHDGPFPRPADWLRFVNEPQIEAELESLRRSVLRGAPFGKESWVKETAVRLGLESSLRPRGRPRKKKDGDDVAQTM
jgi:putative transposase